MSTPAERGGVQINRSVLLENADAPEQNGTALYARREQSAPLAMLQSKARALGAFDIEAIIGRFDPDRIAPKQKRQMRRDPMINLGLHYRKSLLINAKWHVDCDDPVVRAFDEGCLRQIYARLMAQMCLRDPFGYVPIVKRFQREVPKWTYEDPLSKESRPVWPDGTIPAVTWNTFQALPPEGAEPTFSGDGKTFVGFRHHGLSRTMDAAEPLVVDAAHALWVSRNFDEEFGNWYGYPLTGHAFRYWWSYWYQWLLADRHMEQDADPPLRVDYPPGQSFDPDSPGEQVDNYLIALKAGQQLRDGATVAMPSDYYESVDTGQLARGARKWDMEFMRGGENIDAFHKSFAYLDVAKLLALLVPSQALMGAKGSLSGDVAETYLGAMTESAAVEMAQLDAVINDYMLPDLNAQNFVDPPRATKVTEGFRQQDIALGIDLLHSVAGTDPAGLQVNWRQLADRHDLPLYTPEELERIEEEARKKFEMAQEAALRTQQTKDAADAQGGDRRPTGPNQDGKPTSKPNTKIAGPGSPTTPSK